MGCDRSPKEVAYSTASDDLVAMGLIAIRPGGVEDPRVRALLEHHVLSARAATAPGSAHALDLDGLMAANIHFWSAWDEGRLVGVCALKLLSDDHGEIKSMHTEANFRRKGVGSALLLHIIDAASAMGLRRLSLETGSWAYFAPARELYKRHGFADCSPFGDYTADPNSVFMSRDLWSNQGTR